MPQSLADILLHIVFSTKGRHPWILPEIEQELYRYLGAICQERGCHILEIGGVADHIHLLISFGRSVTVSQLILDMKANSSRWIKTKGVGYKEFSWQRGYGIFSVARSSVNSVVKYISTQKEHHKKMSYKEELLAMLKRAQIKFDEQFLWD